MTGAPGAVSVNRHGQWRRSRTGISGRIGRGGGETMGRHSKAPLLYSLQAPLVLATTLLSSVAPSKILTVAFASAVPLNVSVLSLVM